MTATTKNIPNRPVQVSIRNPAVLDRIIQGLKDGYGRNYTEVAENLLIAGEQALREKEHATASAR